MLLTNCAEIYLSNGHHTLSLYGAITAGRILNSWVMLNKDIQTHTPPFMWDMSAGARSIFIIKNIQPTRLCTLTKTFALNAEKPRRLVDQWKVFGEIAQHESVTNPWLTTIIFFKKWFEHIDDPRFNDLQKYFYKTAWQSSDYLRNQFIWNYIYSIIEKNRI